MTQFDPNSVEFLGLLTQVEEQRLPAAPLSPQAAEAVLGEVADGVLVTDERGLVIYSNPLVSEMTGEPSGPQPGQSLNEALRLHDGDGSPLPVAASPWTTSAAVSLP